MKKGDRVRHKNEADYKKYGVLEIWEIKNGHATCRHGDFSNFGVLTISLAYIRKVKE